MNVYDLKNINASNLKPRQAQKDLLKFAQDCVLSNKKHILIDAPTGIGKSFQAVMFMDWFKTNYDISANFDILTNSKILQEQYTKDFDFINSLQGKDSYKCDTYNCTCGMGMEQAKIQNKKCEECPYAEAKYMFENGDVALTNFHLFLTYMIHMPMAQKRSSRVLIIDEAHDIESVFADFITTKISKPLLKRNGLTDEEVADCLNVFGDYPEDLEIKQFTEIIDKDFLPLIRTVINRLAREAEEGNLQSLSHLQSLSTNVMKQQILKTEYDKLPNNQILENDIIKKYNKEGKLSDSYIELTAQPVWSYPYLNEIIQSRYDYIIYMSATILDKDLFCKINGINNEESAYICLDSPFPVENRPIYYFHKSGKQTFKTKEIVQNVQKKTLGKILKKHKTDKGIIHTSNYEIQGQVKKEFNEDRILIHDSNNRADVLNQHYNTTESTVLVSPSMHVGVDLKDDFSRHQTILKIPYPNLNSKKIKKRMETIKEQYSQKSCADLIQSYGRSVRSETDKANTYILDSCFGDLLKQSSRYFPKQIKNAIHYVE